MKKALELLASASSFPLCITFGLHHRSHRWCGTPGTTLQSLCTCSSMIVLNAPSLATRNLQTLRHLCWWSGLFWRPEQGIMPLYLYPTRSKSSQHHTSSTHAADLPSEGTCVWLISPVWGLAWDFSSISTVLVLYQVAEPECKLEY